MISLNQVRAGQRIIFRLKPYEVLEANHLKVGRGGAKLVTKLRNLLDQSIIEFTFAGDEKLDEAEVGYRTAQYLYAENGEHFFMTNDDFETLSLKLSEARARFLTEGLSVDLMIWQRAAIDVKLPPKVELTISYTEPGFKGNTASAALKPATLETGAQVNVPLFIATGEKIIVNTETGEYVSRAGK